MFGLSFAASSLLEIFHCAGENWLEAGSEFSKRVSHAAAPLPALVSAPVS